MCVLWGFCGFMKPYSYTYLKRQTAHREREKRSSREAHFVRTIHSSARNLAKRKRVRAASVRKWLLRLYMCVHTLYDAAISHAFCAYVLVRARYMHSISIVFLYLFIKSTHITKKNLHIVVYRYVLYVYCMQYGQLMQSCYSLYSIRPSRNLFVLLEPCEIYSCVCV